MRVVIQESEFEFIFETPDLPAFDGSDEAYEKRGDILMEELTKRAQANPEQFPGFKENGYIRDHYVDKVTPLPGNAELWGLGT